MLCAELMRGDHPFLYEDDVAQTAAQRMRDHETGFLPVCDFGKRVTGTLTDHDLVTRLCAENRPTSTERVLDVMTKGISTCRVEDDVARALAVMNDRNADAVVIVDGDGLLCGVLERASIREPSRAVQPVGLMRESAARQLRGDEA